MRHATIHTLVVIAVAALAATAAAQGTNVHDCSFCHVTHGAPGPTLTLAADVELLCLTCHGAAGSSPLKAEVHENEPGGSYNFRMTCVDCHTPHSSRGNWLGGTNLKQVGAKVDDSGFARIATPNSGIRDVTFESLGTDAGDPSLHSYADSDEDGNGVYDGACEVCHTITNHHTNDAADPDHYTGTSCTICHAHENGFRALPHPTPVSDCSICHLNPDTGEPDLYAPHDYDCDLCHTSGFNGTFLGPLGTWQGECDECHNPSVSETGNKITFEKGHRCIVCHDQQLNMNSTEHRQHLDRSNCVVCHGEIPDMGVVIGSGDRQICYLCHSSPDLGMSQEDIHKQHVPDGGSCLECHSNERPPVDVVDGPPVGGSSNVCEICHTDKQPGEFQGDMEREHERHTGDRIDCGGCHMAAEYQDDRDPMPPLDDTVRAQVPRGGFAACVHCHEGGHSGSAVSVHNRHVAEQFQWCYNCHLPSDVRPIGQAPPITQPADSCQLCHSNRTYEDTFPFDQHERHSKREVKCYACHQTTPQLFDWPDSWHTP